MIIFDHVSHSGEHVYVRDVLCTLRANWYLQNAFYMSLWDNHLEMLSYLLHETTFPSADEEMGSEKLSCLPKVT